MDGMRRRRHTPGSRSVAAVVGALVLLAAAGCTAVTPTAVETTAPSTPTPTPTSSAAHTIAFDGSCADMLPADRLESLIGADAALVDTSRQADVGLGTLGGLQCVWRTASGASASPSGALTLSVDALPASAVADDLADEVSTARCDYELGLATCEVGEGSDGTWITARASYDALERPSDVQPLTDLVTSTLAAVASSASGAVMPVALQTAPEWWRLGLDCTEFGNRLGMADFLGEQYVTGWWEGDPTARWEYRVPSRAGTTQVCMWFPDAAASAPSATYGLTSVTLSPGGSWDRDRLLSLGNRVELAGGRIAVVDGTRAVAVDGVNVASVDVGSGATGDPTVLLERVLDAMDSSR